MTQSIVVQIGQCGNQIGCQFWELALREHASQSHRGIYDEPLGTFFRNVDTRYSPPTDLPFKSKIADLKARAVLIDMEEGVVNGLLHGPLRDVFDNRQQITSVSGSGNNWAVGYYNYGKQYREQISETIRRATEFCDCLQSFLLLHSMGGGTGSGLGTFVLELLADEYPDIYRFVTAVYPSADDDVVTSPYNSVLAMHQLQEYADCVLPVENQALSDIVDKIDHESKGKLARPQTAVTEDGSKKSKPWDRMNNIVANMLLNLSSSSRFEGSLNVDVNEITMNMVPFPKMHFLVSSLTPLYNLADVHVAPRRLDQMFTDAFNKDYQLTKCDPKHGVFSSCALLLRGNVEISDVRRNIDRLKPSLKFVHWNQDGWKTGLCSVPPVGQPHALLCLSNNTCLKSSFVQVRERFTKLYKKKAYKHHFLSEGMEESRFEQSIEGVDDLIARYEEMDAAQDNPPPAPRLAIP